MWPWLHKKLIQEKDQPSFLGVSCFLHMLVIIAALVAGRSVLYPLIQVKNAIPGGAAIVFMSSAKGIQMPKGAIKRVALVAKKVVKKIEPAVKKALVVKKESKPANKPIKKLAEKKITLPAIKPIVAPVMQASIAAPVDTTELEEGEPIVMSHETYDALSVAFTISRAVSDYWTIPRGVAAHCTCDVKVVVSFDGKLGDVVIVKSSRVVLYDSAARAAAVRAVYPKEVWGKTFTLRF